MPRYTYVATRPDGTEVKAKAEAANEAALRRDLLLKNLDVGEVALKKSLNIELSKQRVPRAEIMHFSRQLASFIRSGISLMEALEVIREGVTHKRFSEVLSDLRESLSEGVAFSEALAHHASILPPYYLGIVQSAELTGRLDTALEQLATYIERDLESRSKLKAALTYPIIVAAMSIGVVVLMAVFVLPKFTKFFENMHSKLPLPTRMLLAVSHGTRTFWYVEAGLVALFVLAIVASKKTARGGAIRDRIFLRLPLIGTIVQYAVVERFCRILGAMVRAGVSLPEALQAAITGANNRVFELKLHAAQERMLEGDGLAEPLGATQVLPRAALQMIRVGESTGTLDLQLENAAAYYSRELEWKLKRLTSLFEPMVILFMGAVVGFVAVALISAMYGVFQNSSVG
ncbi:MAG: type pilus assembly protein PilC [Actinomycetota bacterium]|nr:type pilus assembly protein PilC [Actinomycetota bacterium]